MPNNTVPADGEAVPTPHTISIDSLQPLKMDELRAVYDALRFARTALLSILNQPRFSKSESELNGAGDIIDRLLEHVDQCAELVVGVTAMSHPSSSNDIEERAWLLLVNEAASGGSIPAFLTMAADQNKLLSSAIWHEKNLAKGAQS